MTWFCSIGENVTHVKSNAKTQLKFSNFQHSLRSKYAIYTPRWHSEYLHRLQKFSLSVQIKISLTKSAKPPFDSVNTLSTIHLNLLNVFCLSSVACSFLKFIEQTMAKMNFLSVIFKGFICGQSVRIQQSLNGAGLTPKQIAIILY